MVRESNPLKLLYLTPEKISKSKKLLAKLEALYSIFSSTF